MALLRKKIQFAVVKIYSFLGKLVPTVEKFKLLLQFEEAGYSEEMLRMVSDHFTAQNTGNILHLDSNTVFYAVPHTNLNLNLPWIRNFVFEFPVHRVYVRISTAES